MAKEVGEQVEFARLEVQRARVMTFTDTLSSAALMAPDRHVNEWMNGPFRFGAACRYLWGCANIVWGRLALRWKLLGSFGLVLLLAGGAAAVGLYRLDTALSGYHALLDGSVAAAKQADDVNTAFVSRHKVLKDIYLLQHGSRPRSSPSPKEIADWDKQVSEGLAALRADPVLLDEDRDLIDSGLAPFAEYQKASQAALERATVEGDDPYTAQQAAAKLTSGKDRPVSAVLKELSTRLNERARTEGSAIESDVDALLRSWSARSSPRCCSVWA